MMVRATESKCVEVEVNENEALRGIASTLGFDLDKDFVVEGIVYKTVVGYMDVFREVAIKDKEQVEILDALHTIRRAIKDNTKR